MTEIKTKTETPPKSIIRETIIRRIKQLGLTNYQFAHSGKVDAAPSSVYRFLKGDVECGSGNLEAMLVALGLRIETTTRPSWAREARKEREERERESSAN